MRSDGVHAVLTDREMVHQIPRVYLMQQNLPRCPNGPLDLDPSDIYHTGRRIDAKDVKVGKLSLPGLVGQRQGYVGRASGHVKKMISAINDAFLLHKAIQHGRYHGPLWRRSTCIIARRLVLTEMRWRQMMQLVGQWRRRKKGDDAQASSHGVWSWLGCGGGRRCGDARAS